MPSLKDNDPAKWAYADHIRVKHEILSRYLDSWTTILGKYHTSVAYVDGFAGRGRYTPGDQPGSPLLAADAMLNTLKRADLRLQRVDFHLIEPDSDNLANLRAEVDKHWMSQSPSLRIHYYDTAFSAASDAIINHVTRWNQPAFFFLDPFGYQDLPMSVVERILRLPKSETLINYMFDFIRWATGMSDPSLRQTLDRLHGNPSWSACASLNGDSREYCLRDNYRQELKHRGAKFVMPFRMGHDERDRTLYYLFHASSHLTAVKNMRDAMVKAGSPGHAGYAGEARHQMLLLFDYYVSMLPGLLRQLFAGRELSYDEVIAESIELSGTCVDKDYRACLKAMEQRGEVTVRRITSTTNRGLSGQDRINFEKPE